MKKTGNAKYHRSPHITGDFGQKHLCSTFLLVFGMPNFHGDVGMPASHIFTYTLVYQSIPRHIFFKPSTEGVAWAAGETPQGHCQPTYLHPRWLVAGSALPFRRYSPGDAEIVNIKLVDSTRVTNIVRINFTVRLRHPTADMARKPGSCRRPRPLVQISTRRTSKLAALCRLRFRLRLVF